MATTMTGERSCGDVVMVPLWLKGHINPMTYVAKGLMKRGITVTMVIVLEMEPLIDAEMKDGIEGFNLVVIPPRNDVAGGRDWNTDRPMTGPAESLERRCQPFFTKLLAQQESGVRGPKCIVDDQFIGWTQIWADKLNIPRYVSFPSPASFAVTMLFHASVLNQVEKDMDSNLVIQSDPVISLPGIPELHLSDLPVSFRHEADFREKIINRNGKTFRQAAGMLFNTVYELESKAIETFRNEVERTSSPGKVTRMLPIGPMLPPEFFSEDAYVGGIVMDVDAYACLEWLDTQLSSSVLYIAFGSGVFLSAAQVQELAHGLESSQVPFLWILRTESPNSDVSKILPPGFEARTKDRGLVWTEFAPQLQILSHPATGGFLTHCGWNSCLESISRGIPMVGWPMKAEQGLSCRLLVDELKTATEFKKRPDGSVERGEVERAIRILMTSHEREELTKRTLELQRQVRAARAPGGSSHANFEWLVKEILGQH